MNAAERLRSLFPEEGQIPAEARQGEPVCQERYLVDGELRQWAGPWNEVVSSVRVVGPQGLAALPLGRNSLLTPKECLEALEAAVRAYDHGRGAWATLPVAGRIERVEDFTYRMKQARAAVVKLLMWEVGKSLEDSEREFDRTVAYIQDTIAALKDLDRISSRFVIEQGVIGQIRRAPLGVVLCMGPFNYPLNETFTTLIPALIMGNTVVVKPPRLGVLLFEPLLEAFQTSFPRGVVNFIYGEGSTIIPPLMSSDLVDALAFIGSARVAASLEKLHPRPNRLRRILGLDAKNPAIVLPDADLDLTVRECLLGCLSFNGQRCTALKILFVHSEVVESFLARLEAGISGLKLGMPWEKGVFLTPLAEPAKPKKLTELIEDALRLGARVVNQDGGAVAESLFYPAVVYPARPGMRLYAEEQFGPVIPVVPFDTIETPIRYVVESQYGQQVSLFGRNPDLLATLVDFLVNQVCRVNLNSQCQRGPDLFPFTGRKDSAEGTLSVSDALRVFSIRTLVAAKETEVNKELITRIVRERKSKFLSTDYIL
jgi:glyceraldehyde-3-phosphate dehydrogenase (NADP+)